MDDALFSIEVGAKYYYELKKVFVALMADTGSADDLVVKIANVSAGKVNNIQEHMLHLMYVLINEIEEQAVREGKVEDKPLESNSESPEN